MLKKVFIKEYEYFTLYGIYLNGKLIYKTKAIKSIKADVILRGEL